MSKAGNVWLGVALGAVLDIGAAALFLQSRRAPLILAIGVVQLAWMLPAYLAFKLTGNRETAKGILIASGICFLLNAACWGVVFGVMRR